MMSEYFESFIISFVSVNVCSLYYKLKILSDIETTGITLLENLGCQNDVGYRSRM